MLANHLRPILVAATALLSQSSAITQAAEGDPLAIRRWPAGVITVESHWDLHLAIGDVTKVTDQFNRMPDQVIDSKQTIDSILQRLPNQEKANWLPSSQADKSDINAVQVSSISIAGSDEKCIRVAVDGVRILIVPQEGFAQDWDVEKTQPVDVLVLTVGDVAQLPEAVAMVKALSPRTVLLNSLATSPSLPSEAGIDAFCAAVGGQAGLQSVNHNTLAVSQTTHATETGGSSPAPQVVMLSTKPWQMPEELSKLFAAMEKTCSDSQQVFAKLSVEQMNFKPSNGTHTPRWNTEHMMGRQLLFFSQIYHSLDSNIHVRDLNPKQMPPDYTFAHPDWDGREEARQMQRVSSFTRRFAYLLADLDVDERAPGSNWPTLRALLAQMHRHYSEHTENTIKKFDLPDWPKN